ncbi:MAG: 6-O-methylguanine DNA methyltransferase [Polaromonas sp.]
MADRKSWRERLAGFQHLPQVKPIPQAMQARHGQGSIVIPSPQEVNAIMAKIPETRLVTIFQISDQLAYQHGTTIACTVTTGIFANMAARAAGEDEADGKNATPYWRCLKKDGELNAKYPGGISALMSKLEAEGHTVVQKGKRFVVQDFEKQLISTRML